MEAGANHPMLDPDSGTSRAPFLLAAGGLLALWAAAVLAWAWLALPQPGAFAHVQVTVTGEANTRHQMYYATSPTFTEAQSAFIPAGAGGTGTQALRLTPSDLRYIRIDPGSDARARLCRLDVNSGTTGLGSLHGFTIVRSKQLTRLEQGKRCLDLIPEQGATDPYVVLEAPAAVRDWKPPTPSRGMPGVLASLALGVAAVLVLLAARTTPLGGMTSRLATGMHARLPLVYAVLATTLGLGYLLVTPPGAVPDEMAHATKAVKVAHGELMGDTGDREFPNLYHLYGEFNGFRNPTTRFSTAELSARAESPVLCEPTTTNLPSGADSYGPHLYLGPSMAYATACATGSSFGGFLWASRAGNLLLAVLLSAMGMWSSSQARWPLFVIALMPMTLFQMASISADALYFGLCFAWLGLTCGVAENRLSARRAAPALVLLITLITFSKPGGAWVLSSVLFLRPAFVREYGRFWPALICYLVLPAIAHAVWVLAAGTEAVPLAGVDPEFNLAQLSRDPAHVLELFVAAHTGAHGWGLLRSMMGQLGWLDILLPAWSYATILACLLATLLLARGGARPPLSTRALAACFTLGSLVMLSIPLYLFWTPPDASRIGGLQGRYFIPSLAFAWTWLALSGPRRLQDALMLILPIAMTLPLLHGLLAIAMRYYPL